MNSSSHQQKRQKALAELQEQCRDSVANSLRTISESLKITSSTTHMLAEQTERLQRIDRQSDNISQNLDQSDHLISGMKSWWTSLVHYINPVNDYKNINDQKIKVKKDSNPSSPQSSSTFSKSEDLSRFNTTSRPIAIANHNKFDKLLAKNIKYGSEGSNEEFEQAIDQDLDKLSDMIKNLHFQSKSINQEIVNHNDMLDGISVKISRNSDRMKSQNKEIKDLYR